MPGELKFNGVFRPGHSTIIFRHEHEAVFVLKFPALFLKCPENVSVFLSLMNSLCFISILVRRLTPPITLFLISGKFQKQVNRKSIKIVCVIIRFWMIVITQKGYSTEQFMMMNKLLLQLLHSVYFHFSPARKYAECCEKPFLL